MRELAAFSELRQWTTRATPSGEGRSAKASPWNPYKLLSSKRNKEKKRRLRRERGRRRSTSYDEGLPRVVTFALNQKKGMRRFLKFALVASLLAFRGAFGAPLPTVDPAQPQRISIVPESECSVARAASNGFAIGSFCGFVGSDLPDNTTTTEDFEDEFFYSDQNSNICESGCRVPWHLDRIN